jgi:hypothetical protein
LDATLGLKFIQHRLDEPFCATRIDDKFLGGLRGSGGPLQKRQRPEE